MAVSKAQFNKIRFEQLSSDPVLTAILNGDEVDSEQGKYYFFVLYYCSFYIENT